MTNAALAPLYLLAAWLASLPRSRPGSCDSLTQEPGRSHVHTTQEASTMATSDTAVPTWQAEIKRKHELQIVLHQERFGLLGRLMTKEQKAALKKANRELKAVPS